MCLLTILCLSVAPYQLARKETYLALAFFVFLQNCISLYIYTCVYIHVCVYTYICIAIEGISKALQIRRANKKNLNCATKLYSLLNSDNKLDLPQHRDFLYQVFKFYSLKPSQISFDSWGNLSSKITLILMDFSSQYSTELWNKYLLSQ